MVYFDLDLGFHAIGDYECDGLGVTIPGGDVEGSSFFPGLPMHFAILKRLEQTLTDS